MSRLHSRSQVKLRRPLTIEPLEHRTLLAAVMPTEQVAGSGDETQVVSAAPTVLLAGRQSTLQGDVYELGITIQGGSTSLRSLQVDWGDGRQDRFEGSRTTVFHTYAAAGQRLIRVMLLDTAQRTVATSQLNIEVLSADNRLVDSRSPQVCRLSYLPHHAPAAHHC